MCIRVISPPGQTTQLCCAKVNQRLGNTDEELIPGWSVDVRRSVSCLLYISKRHFVFKSIKFYRFWFHFLKQWSFRDDTRFLYSHSDIVDDTILYSFSLVWEISLEHIFTYRPLHSKRLKRIKFWWKVCYFWILQCLLFSRDEDIKIPVAYVFGLWGSY